ncbi:MAG: hypothetical protein JAZ03_11140 [Candidatus Thiodiazotropha taylori]|nr:hypothetical protein [Candidatus Thiodiazotropha taylori]MCW4334480.1 hypothetical protein [Candidatus Thiodiazotropha endolucinida]
MRVGDIVLLKDDNQPRNRWRIGRVVDTFKDEDGLIRKVKLVLADPNLNMKGKRTDSLTFLERPVHKLVLLLESETEEIPDREPNSNEN